MSIVDLSIKRPVLATVLNLLIVLAGIAGWRALPVREYPDVDSPVVSIRTAYVGANPLTVESTITVPLEEAIKGIEGIRTITSNSGNGASAIDIELVTGRDVDAAANDVTNAIQSALGKLPGEAERPTVSKSGSGTRPVIWLAVQGDRYAPPDLSDIADRTVKTPLQVLPGVANVIIGGQRTYAMRIWLDPEEMAVRGVDPADIQRTIRENNLQLPAGRIEGTTRQLAVLSDAQIDDPRVYENLIVRDDGESVVRLGDIGSVELGASSYGTVTRFNGTPTIGVGIVRQSRANELAVADAVYAAMPAIQAALPSDVTLKVAVDSTIFVKQSLAEVAETLGIAFALVVLVNLIFLRSLTTTFITSVSIPVAAVGVFAVLQLFDYSINVLTLLGLVLAIGLLVDDAIVVLESVYRHQEMGEPPLTAAIRGSREVAFPVIATSLSLIAVLVPLGLLTGQTGRLFREFAVTVAGTIVLSTFVALTLIPMLCSKMLRLSASHGFVYRVIERGLEGMNRGYEVALAWSLRHKVIVLGLLLGSVVASGYFYEQIPQTLAPVEDRGRFLTIVKAPQGSTLAYTDQTVRKAEADIREVPGLKGYFSAIGLSFGGPATTSSGIIFSSLLPWDERTVTQQSVVASLFPKFMGKPGALLFPINPASLGQSGNSDVELVIKSSSASLDELAGVVGAILERARKVPGLTNVDTDLLLDNPQLDIQFDRDRAADLGVSIESIARAIQLMVSESKTDEFILRNRQYDVVAAVYPRYRSTPEQLGRIHLRTKRGDMVPLDNLITSKTRAAPAELRHFGLVRSATISGSLAEGVSLGAALDQVQAIAAEEMPSGFSSELAGASREFADSSSELLITFLIAIVFIYLVLSAQFENFVHSLTILLSVPLATFGALFTLWAVDESLNIFSQIGMVLLVGLVTKNAILLVDFANQERAKGVALVDAVLEAGKTRFRPILMTSATSILGALPLWTATGAGAESRHPIGAAVVGGLLFSTAFTLLVVPVVYLLLVRAAERVGIGMIPPAVDLGTD